MPQSTVEPSKMAEQIAADHAYLVKRMENLKYNTQVSGEQVVTSTNMLLAEAISEGAYAKLYPSLVTMKEEG